MLEYAILASAISATIVAVVESLGQKVQGLFSLVNGIYP